MICSFFFIYFCPLRILIINLTIMKRKVTLLFLVTFVLLLGAVAQEKLKTVIPCKMKDGGVDSWL